MTYHVFYRETLREFDRPQKEQALDDYSSKTLFQNL